MKSVYTNRTLYSSVAEALLNPRYRQRVLNRTTTILEDAEYRNDANSTIATTLFSLLPNMLCIVIETIINADNDYTVVMKYTNLKVKRDIYLKYLNIDLYEILEDVGVTVNNNTKTITCSLDITNLNIRTYNNITLLAI